MKQLFAQMIDDRSGSVVAEHTLVTIVLPILCLLMLVAAGISMVTGASLAMVPSVIGEMLLANFSA